MRERGSATYVFGPDGSVLTMADLPPPTVGRWSASRKAAVVAAVRGGLLSLSQACTRYSLSIEEFLLWESALDHHGTRGLHVTKLGEYRGI